MLEKAKFLIGESKTEIKVMFNPESYSVESNVQYSESSAIYNGLSVIQFKQISPRTMSVELYFDTLNGSPFSQIRRETMVENYLGMEFASSGDVSAYTSKFHELVKWDKDKKCTPIVTFSWGSYSFVGVITKITEKFTMFRPDGVPIRANMTVSMTELTEAMSNGAKGIRAANSAAAKLSSSQMTDVSEQQKKAVTEAAKAALNL